MNRPAVSQAKMQRMRRALLAEGLPFRGFRTHPDGSVEALVGDPEPLTPAANGNLASDPLQDELEEWSRQHGYS